MGALFFGFVVGWVTYRTLRRSQTAGISDIASVIGAVGGAAVTGLFSKESGAFGTYCIGLAVGFFLYLITALFVANQAGKSDSANEWLGEPPKSRGSPEGGPLPPE